jgi:N-acyl-D-aspartate/D-glutamate deacylase
VSRPASPSAGPVAALLLVAALPATAAAVEPVYDLLLAGGTVVDGTGAARFAADVAVAGDRIARVSHSPIDRALARAVVDVTGKVVAPGFIDSHAHLVKLDTYPLAENLLRQGVTSILASLHAQDEPWPLGEYLARVRPAPNVGFFAGHSFIRKRVVGLEDRAPTATELEAMEELVAISMREGALGLATGLEYVPANYARTGEIVELAKVAARYGGSYSTHMRDEGPGLLDSIDETIRIGREAGLPVQINHLKAAGAAQFGWSVPALARIDAARAAGVDIAFDVYPYTAFSTDSDVCFPPWSLAGGPEAFRRRVADPATRARIEREMLAILPIQTGRGAASLQFRDHPLDPRLAGKTLADDLAALGQADTAENAVHRLVDLQAAGSFEGIFHAMDEDDLRRFLVHPLAMVISDADLVGYGVGYPHPRSYGTFPRVLGHYVRELMLLSLEEAIRKMTSAPAARIGQSDRGVVREGAFADLVVFDPDAIRDLATYDDPHRPSVGVEQLLVNGVAVIRDGGLTGERPGRVLRRSGGS